MKITCLGTGTPESHKRRASSGYLIEVGTDKILFDCGGGVVSRLIEAGYKPGDITHLFFSHLHSDHMLDYARLVHAAWDEKSPPLHVWGPPPLKNITEKLFGPDGVMATDLIARTQFKGSQEVWTARGGTLPRPWPEPVICEIEAGFSYQGDGWRLSSCNAPHAQPYLDCMAFRIDTGTHSFVYSGDAGLCDEVETLCADASLVLHWCYRMSHETDYPTVMEFSPSAGEIAEMAERAGVEHLMLTHLRAHMDSEAYHAQMMTEARACFSGKLGIAEDLMVFTLGA